MELNRVLIVDDDPAIRRVVSALLDLTMPRLDGLRPSASCWSSRARSTTSGRGRRPPLAADEQLRYGFLLHDVGKVGIPESVLNKPGPLDASEWEVMRAHPLLGVQMVAGIKSMGSAVEVIRCHHERWDGKGYPSGLAGEAIPAGARVFSVADAFDAMTSDRPYRKAIPFDRACQEIADGAGSQFDPAVVEAFTAIVPDLPDLHASLHDGGAVDSLAHSIP